MTNSIEDYSSPTVGLADRPIFFVNKITEVIEITNKLVIDYKSRTWCKLPYPNHPNGCPNYGKKDECPPQVEKIDDWLDLSKPHWIIVTKFDLASHVKRMKKKHPDWSDKQARCVLYWQNTVRKNLRDAIKKFRRSKSGTVFTLLPEAMGIHVLATARKVNIPITSKPKDIIYKIALIGYPKQLEGQQQLDFSYFK